MLHICKGYRPLFSCENIWFQRLVLCQCPQVQFPFQSFLVEEILLAMVKKTLDRHVLPNLKFVITISASFNLWMSHDGVDTFVLVIIFLNEAWVSMHVIVGLFEVHKTSEQSMAIQL